jgi:TolB protein
MTESKMARGVIRTTVVTATAAACLIGVPTSGATFRGANGLLVYQAQAGKHIQLFTIRPEGTGRRQITHLRDSDALNPAWSPDGRRIAFVSGRSGNFDVLVMDADGRGLHRLTRNRADDLFPSWAPDGTQLVFQSARTGDPEIHTMNADGTDVRRVTDSPAPNFEPSWSPAGDRIVFMRRLTNQELFSIAPDGTGELRLTADSGEDFDPSWSPDGAKIVWTSDRAGTYDLYTMDADGTGVCTARSYAAGCRPPS